MPIDVAWGNSDQTLITMTLADEWGWHEFYRAAGIVTRMMVTVSHTVDILLDLTHSRYNPPDFPVHAARPSFHRRNVGVVIAVQQQPITRLSRSPTRPKSSRIYGNVIYTRSRTEAQAILSVRPA